MAERCLKKWLKDALKNGWKMPYKMAERCLKNWLKDALKIGWKMPLKLAERCLKNWQKDALKVGWNMLHTIESKVCVFLKGHKNWRNLHRQFDTY